MFEWVKRLFARESPVPVGEVSREQVIAAVAESVRSRPEKWRLVFAPFFGHVLEFGWWTRLHSDGCVESNGHMHVDKNGELATAFYRHPAVVAMMNECSDNLNKSRAELIRKLSG